MSHEDPLILCWFVFSLAEKDAFVTSLQEQLRDVKERHVEVRLSSIGPRSSSPQTE